MFKKMFPYALVALLISLSTNLLFYVIGNRPYIATVDVGLITSEFIKQEAKNNHSNHEKEVAIKAFSHALEDALQQLSKSKSLILLPKEAVIKGSHDYTKELTAIMNSERQS